MNERENCGLPERERGLGAVLVVRVARIERVLAEHVHDPLAERGTVHQRRTVVSAANTDVTNACLHVAELTAWLHEEVLSALATFRYEDVAGGAVMVEYNGSLHPRAYVGISSQHDVITVFSQFFCHWLFNPFPCIFAGK